MIIFTKIQRLFFLSFTLSVLMLQTIAQTEITSNHELSDKRLKKEITSLLGSYSKIRMLEGIHYKWNEISGADTTTIQTGLIAQEVEKMFPELIKTDEQGYKSIDYNGLIPHLIEAIKVLEVKIEQLEAPNQKLDELETRIRILENQQNKKPAKSTKAKSRGN